MFNHEAARRLRLVLAVSFATCILVGCEQNSGIVSAENETLTTETDRTSGQMTKVELCHYTGADTYEKITVAEPAYETHLEHGDRQVGADGSCAPVVCPCFTELDFDRYWSSFTDNLYNGLRTTNLSGTSPDDIFGVTAQVTDNSCSMDGISANTTIDQAEATYCRALLYEAADENALTCVGSECES